MDGYGRLVNEDDSRRPKSPHARVAWSLSALGVDATSVRSRALILSRDVMLSAGLPARLWQGLARYLRVAQEEFDLLPLHFVPEEQTSLSIDLSSRQVNDLCVASKLLYAHIRWLDSLVDDQQEAVDPQEIHGLNNALGKLINTTLGDALSGQASTSLFATLSELYGSYALSSALDSAAAPDRLEEPITVESYASHAKARTAPMRAPVDAVLMVSSADQNLVNAAREAFESCMIAIQFYDDCLDVEEDFAAQRGSWLVRRIVSERKRIACLAGKAGTSSAPTADDFYAGALRDGHIDEALATSLQYFGAARSTSEQVFPGWARIQSKLIQRVQSLRNEYRNVVAYHDK